LNDEYGADYLTPMGQVAVTTSIKYLQSWLRSTYELPAYAGSFLNRVAHGQTLSDAAGSETFIFGVRKYFDNFGEGHSLIQAGASAASGAIAGMAFGPVIGAGTTMTVAALMTRTFIEGMIEEFDVNNITAMAGRIHMRLVQTLGVAIQAAGIAGTLVSYGTGYSLPTIPSTADISYFLTNLFNTYLQFERKMLEK